MSDVKDTNFYCIGSIIYGDKYKKSFEEKGFYVNNFTFSNPNKIYYTRPHSVEINAIDINNYSSISNDLINIIKSTFTLIEYKLPIKKFTINKYDSVLMKHNNKWVPTVLMGYHPKNDPNNKFEGTHFYSNIIIPINNYTLKYMETSKELDFIPELTINIYMVNLY